MPVRIVWQSAQHHLPGRESTPRNSSPYHATNQRKQEAWYCRTTFITKNHMHQRTPATPIAIRKRINGLELRIRNRTLRHHRQIVMLDEFKQIRLRIGNQLRTADRHVPPRAVNSCRFRPTPGSCDRHPHIPPSHAARKAELHAWRGCCFPSCYYQASAQPPGAHIADYNRGIVACSSSIVSRARFFAPTVRFSICEDDDASARSNTALIGPST